MKSIDDILNNPGIFAFQIEEDGTIKHSKAIYPFTDDIVNVILKSISNCFTLINQNLSHYISQSPEYLGQISDKLKKLDRFTGRLFRFPGLQVVNINRAMLSFFSHMPNRFLICEKSDGVRYLLMHLKNGINLFIGRNLEFYMVNFTDKIKDNKEESWELVHFLDGELVVDKCKDNDDPSKNNGSEITIKGEKKRVKFLVFDAIIINKQNIGHLLFKDRLHMLWDFMYTIEMQRHIKKVQNDFIERYSPDIEKSKFLNKNSLVNNMNILQRNEYTRQNFEFAIEIYMKDYFTLEQINELNPEFTERLPHHNDGIIINTDDYPYYSGQATEVFKWKPTEMNTIDFEVIENKNLNVYELYVIDGNSKTPVSFLFFKPDTDDQSRFTAAYSKFGPNIAECFYDKKFNSKETINFNYNYKNTNDIINYNIREMIKKFKSDAYSNLNARDIMNYSRGGWRFLKFRKDKNSANSIKTYGNILQTIREDLKFEDLVREVRKNKDIALREINDTGGCVSAAVWKKFFKEEDKWSSAQQMDFEDDLDFGDTKREKIFKRQVFKEPISTLGKKRLNTDNKGNEEKTKEEKEKLKQKVKLEKQQKAEMRALNKKIEQDKKIQTKMENFKDSLSLLSK